MHTPNTAQPLAILLQQKLEAACDKFEYKMGLCFHFCALTLLLLFWKEWPYCVSSIHFAPLKVNVAFCVACGGGRVTASGPLASGA